MQHTTETTVSLFESPAYIPNIYGNIHLNMPEVNQCSTYNLYDNYFMLNLEGQQVVQYHCYKGFAGR